MISNSFSVSNAITTVVYTPYAKMKLLLSAIDLSTDIDKNQLDQIHHYTIGESLTDSSIFVIGNSSELTEAGFDVNITQKASDICLTVKVADKSLRGHLSGVVKIYEKASKLPLGEVELGASIQSNRTRVLPSIIIASKIPSTFEVKFVDEKAPECTIKLIPTYIAKHFTIRKVSFSIYEITLVTPLDSISEFPISLAVLSNEETFIAPLVTPISLPTSGVINSKF